MLTRVEIPLALPLLVGGFRSADLQVVATATVAAYVGLGGLGRYIIDGQACQRLPADGLRLGPRDRARPRRWTPSSSASRRSPRRTRPSTQHHSMNVNPHQGENMKTRLTTALAVGALGLTLAACGGDPTEGEKAATDTITDRLGGVPRERDHRRDLRPGPRGQGHQGREEAEHRRSRGLHPGPRERRDRPASPSTPATC